MATEHLTLKPDGSIWRVIYGGGTIRWVRAGEQVAGSPQPPAPILPSAPVPGPGGYLQGIAAVADSAAHILQWWEMRQHRLASEAAHEQSQRIGWLTDIMARWAEVHCAGGQLDLRVSEYLARESRAFMEVAASNRRIALPQTLLYELDLVQDSFRSMRETLGQQFEALITSPEIALRDSMREVLSGRSFNAGFVRQLALDPSAEWARRMRSKTPGALDAEFAAAFRYPEVFRDHLFTSTEVERFEPATKVEKNFLETVVDRLVDSLPWPRWEEEKVEFVEKHDDIRELMLLPAEFARVRALHTAWMAATAVVATAHGRDLGVLLSPAGLSLELLPRGPMAELANS